MGQVEFKKIASKDTPIFYEDCGVFNLNEEYVLTDSGLLIDDKGKLIWNVELEHCFSKAIYIKGREVIITDRIISFGMGGDFHLGIACIDIRTGNYRWKYFYDIGISRAKLKNKEPDINMVRNIGSVDIIKGYVYADGFEINLVSGSYKYIGNEKVVRFENKNIVPSKRVKSLKKKEGIGIKIDVINVDGLDFSKEGYFFNKCNFYISSNEYIYFFGIPAKKNPKNAVLFQYSKTQKYIIEEIQLPTRNAPVEVYDFPHKGALFILTDSIWLADGLFSN